MSYNNIKNWRHRTKARAIKAFGGKCGICGYDKHQGALEFHHMGNKEFTLQSQIRSWEKIIKELKKCVCLCVRCHREVECGITNIPKNIKRFDNKFSIYKQPIIKEYNFCPICGKKKLKIRKACSQKCSGILRRKINWNLYDLYRMIKIDKMPIERIAKNIGVSGNSVRKRLIELGLPVKAKDREYTSIVVPHPSLRFGKNKFRGVWFQKSRKKWRVQTAFNNKLIFVGYFDSAVEAAKEYDKKAMELWGNRAITNAGLGLI